MAVSDYLSFPDDLRSRFRRGVSWNVLGAVFIQGSAFLTNILIANLLGRAVFGEFGIIQSTVLTLSGIAQVATGITATKYIAEFRSTDKERAGRVLGFCSLMTFITGGLATVLLVAGAPWLAKYVFNAPHLNTGIAVAAAYVLFSVMNGYQVGALAGLENYRAIAISGGAQGCLHLLICGLAAWRYGLQGALMGVVVSASLRWAIFGLAVRREAARQGIVSRTEGLLSETQILFEFALPAALTGLSSLPAIWLTNAFLVRQPAGFSEMGLFNAANNLRTLVLFFPVLLNNVGTSLLNNQRGQGRASNYRRLFWANMRLTTMATLMGSVAIGFMGTWLLGLYGREFSDGLPILLVLLVAAFFEGVALAAYQVVQSKGRMWLSLGLVALPRDALLVVLAYFLAERGAIGLALAYAVAWMVALFVIGLVNYIIGVGLETKTTHRTYP